MLHASDQAEEMRRCFASLIHPRLREVYGDETLCVLDKPAGVLSHPNPPARRAAGCALAM